MSAEDFGRDNGDGGGGVEKSSGNCPQGAEESCRNCEMFVRVQGIHGTLFYQLTFKKRYFPTKRESEMVPLGTDT
ncbi:MAG: hypothetical protein ABSG03_38875 [Bryobacteraceae bacterium]|jgi:hypothetical protein